MKARSARAALLVATAMAGPAIGQSVTLDYTGVVTEAENFAIGTPVTGTYTFNLAAAVPSQSSGVAPSGSYLATAEGGPGLPFGPEPVAPAPGAYVFSSTTKIGSLSFSTSPASAGCAIYCISSVNVSQNGQVVQAARYDDNGELAFGSWFTKIGDAISGYIIPAKFQAIDFNITSMSSLTPITGVMAPEIDPASAVGALTLLLGGLAVVRGRRRI
jgi:hypothetical protein